MICAPACETALSPDGASLRAVMESQSKLQARLRQQMIELLLELAPNGFIRSYPGLWEAEAAL